MHCTLEECLSRFRDQGIYMTARSARALQRGRWAPRRKHCSRKELCNLSVAQGRLRLRHYQCRRERKRIMVEEMDAKADALEQHNSYLRSVLENLDLEKQLLARWRPISLPGTIVVIRLRPF